MSNLRTPPASVVIYRPGGFFSLTETCYHAHFGRPARHIPSRRVGTLTIQSPTPSGPPD
jgi:hypothetical protein